VSNTVPSGTVSTAFPVDVSMANPDFRIDVTVNGGLTGAMLKSPDGKLQLIPVSQGLMF
jgi:hypothetical protein